MNKRRANRQVQYRATDIMKDGVDEEASHGVNTETGFAEA